MKHSRFWGNDPPTVQIRTVAGLATPDEWCHGLDRAFGEAASKWRKQAFGVGLKLSPSTGVPCVFRLVRRCNHLTMSCQPPGSDHSTLWLRGGRPEVFVTQPYNWGDDTAQAAVAFAREHGLRFTIRPDLSWHYPGHTMLVLWRRAAETKPEGA